MGGAEFYRFIWEVLKLIIKTIMQHSPGGVGGVAEAAAGDGVGMGPANTRYPINLPGGCPLSPWEGETLHTHPPSRIAWYMLKDMWGHNH